MSDTAESATEWVDRARQELVAARTLSRRSLHPQAYQHAGYAVEFAIKACIMRRRGLNRWPDRSEAPELYTHNLGNLLRSAGLEPLVLHEVTNCTILGTAWMVAKDFDVNLRYPGGRPFPPKLSTDLCDAVGKGGLVEWLLSPMR